MQDVLTDRYCRFGTQARRCVNMQANGWAATQANRCEQTLKWKGRYTGEWANSHNERRIDREEEGWRWKEYSLCILLLYFSLCHQTHSLTHLHNHASIGMQPSNPGLTQACQVGCHQTLREKQHGAFKCLQAGMYTLWKKQKKCWHLSLTLVHANLPELVQNSHRLLPWC